MIRRASLCLLALLLASCAAYTLVPAGSRITIANGLSVQPAKAWAASSSTSEPNLRLWTMDGPMLDVMGFVPGLENGGSILKSETGKEPMPVFRSTMAANDVAALFEATLTRAAKTGAIMKTSNLRPATFGGRPGFRFDFTYVNQADEVERKGIAAGAIHNGRLYLIFFHGARIHYFPSTAEEAEAIIRSAQLG